MPKILSNLTFSDFKENQRAAIFLRSHQERIYQSTDRLFAVLMPLQWGLAIILATVTAPFTWNGLESTINPHVWAAVILGGLITCLPVYLALKCPGAAVTRYTIAVSQILMSSLLIHVTNGRIETHFHIFGSLAFLAFYRDWRVLIPATIITAVDHIFRGWFFSQSIYGVLGNTEWRWLEHAAWVIFEDIFLIILCRRSVAEMWETAVHTTALNDSETRYRAVVEQMTEGIFLLEPKTLRVIESNEAFAQIIGYENAEEVKNLAAIDFDPAKPEELEYITKLLQENKESLNAERKYLKKDGSLIYVEIIGRCIEYGENIAFCVNVRDISERKRAEAEIKRLALVAQKTQNAVIITNAKLEVEWVNESFTKTSGYEFDEVIGTNPTNYMYGKDTSEEVIDEIADSLEQEKAFAGEIYIYGKSGDGYWISVSVVPIHSKKGVLQGYIAVQTDITERKAMENALQQAHDELENRVTERTVELLRANEVMQKEVVERKRVEEALSENEAKYRDLFDNAPVAYHELDIHGRFARINKTEELLLGYTNEELKGRHPSEIIVEKESREATAAKLLGKKELHAVERTFVRKDGSLVSVINEDRLIYDSDGNIIGVRSTLQDITDRKDTEDALRTSEARFQSAFDYAPIGIGLVAPNGHWRQVNHSLCNIIGYTKEEFLATSFQRMVHPDDVTESRGYLRKLFEDDNNTFQFENRYIHKLGHEVWALTNLSLARDAQNKPLYFISQIQDISERKEIEKKNKALIQDLAYLKFALDESSIVAVTDQTGKITYCNDNLCKISGYSKNELIGQNHRIINSGFHPKEFFKTMWKTISHGKVWQGEIKNRAKNGSFYWVDTTIVPFLNDEGKPYQYIGIRNDISVRKSAENDLSEAKKFLGRVIDNVPHLIFVKDQEGRYILANQAFASLYGRKVKDVVGKTDSDLLMDHEEIERYRKTDLQVFANKQEFISPEDKFVDSTGATHWMQTIKRPLVGKTGVEYILGIATDLTERKNLESQLQNAQKLESIGQLAAGIAHEINTPTQYVGDNTKFLRDGFEAFETVLEKYHNLLNALRRNEMTDDLITQIEDEIKKSDLEYFVEEVPNAVRQSLDGVSRIAKIVQSMKDFAHPGSKEKSVVDLNRAIESTITVARNEWKYVADMETNFDENLPNIPCLLGEFNQVILNMVINASHAIADVVGDGGNGKGKITISTKQVSDDWAEIRIADTGTGIPTEARNKVFDPFFTTKEVGRGSGQGLAISHTVVVEKHKGKLNFETEAGKGTTFIIQLPITDTSSENRGLQK